MQNPKLLILALDLFWKHLVEISQCLVGIYNKHIYF
jgi:hypothetical protein